MGNQLAKKTQKILSPCYDKKDLNIKRASMRPENPQKAKKSKKIN